MTFNDTPMYGSEEGSIGLRQYLNVIWRRKWTLLLVTALVVGAAAAFTYQQRSEYAAEVTIVVGQAGGLVQPQNANAIQPFSATMTELIKSTVVASAVTRQLQLKLSADQLLSKVSVSFNPESAALKVRVVNHVPSQARAIAQQIGVSFSGLVEDRFGSAAQSKSGSSANPPLTATIWDPAHVVPGRVQPKPAQNLIIASMLGLVLGLLAAFLRDYFDRSLRGTESIERAFGIPVVGQIPSIGKRKKRPRILWSEDHGDFAEAFRTLRANLQYVAVSKPLRTLLITSARPAQGKTTVCANLAIALAQSGSSVVAVETDLRRPVLSGLFGIPPSSAGLTNVLVGSGQLAETIRRIDLPASPGAMADHPGGVAVLPSGPLPPNPSEMVASPKMKLLADGLAQAFDYVLLDSPPILLVADTLELAKMADGVIVVVRSSKATADDAHELRNLAQRLDINLVGIIVTDLPVRPGYGYSQYATETVSRGSEATGARKR